MTSTPHATFIAALAVLTSAPALALLGGSAHAEVTLRPVSNPEVGKSGRAWMVRPPASGDGGMQQLDDVSPAIVGDGQGDQGWGYLMGFVIDEKFATTAASNTSSVTLTVHTAGLALGAHAPIHLQLLDAAQPARKFNQFAAYNVARHLARHEETIPPDAQNQAFTFDVTNMLKGAGVEPGKVAYFLLACDPHTNQDGRGGHLEFVASGSQSPTLQATE
ncbi:MAG: hypothetical protein AAGI68_00775 [Planctomycetota bacterium]